MSMMEGWSYDDNGRGAYYVLYNGRLERAAETHRTKEGGWGWAVYRLAGTGGLYAEEIDADLGESSRVIAEGFCEKYLYELGLIFDPEEYFGDEDE